MKPILNCITIPVADLGKSQHFYEAILEEQAVEASDDLVLFTANEQAYLVLSTIKDFERYADITGLRMAPAGSSECIMSFFLDSTAAVDQLMQVAASAGGTLSGPAKVYAWGYAGYFRDLDGHQWECLFNEKLAQEQKEG